MPRTLSSTFPKAFARNDARLWKRLEGNTTPTEFWLRTYRMGISCRRRNREERKVSALSHAFVVEFDDNIAFVILFWLAAGDDLCD